MNTETTCKETTTKEISDIVKQSVGTGIVLGLIVAVIILVV
jgi:hypothetical protein